MKIIILILIKWGRPVLGLLLAVILLLTGCAVANRFYIPPSLENAEITSGQGTNIQASSRLSVVTWNIGYAGMGRDSDFVFDLGEQRRPLSGELVDLNLQAIQQRLPSLDADLYMLQEVAKPSWVTYQRDVLGGVTSALPEYDWIFGADIDTRYVPPPFGVKAGNMILSRLNLSSAERRGLPLEPNFKLGIFRKGYRMHIVRIDEQRSWVFINIHLSTFDSEEDDVRRKQVSALIEFAESEYEKGNHVVIGGDWNLRLTDTEFPHQTDDRFRFWIRDFPQELVPDGWRWAVDESVPTVRTAHQPYVKGDNYVLTIDGFLTSPNVNVLEVEGLDLNFEHTDHHPVQAVFEASIN